MPPIVAPQAAPARSRRRPAEATAKAARKPACDRRAVATFGLSERTDESLVAMVRSGSERAYEEILRRYRRPLQAYCAQRLGPSRAEDAVQQAFLQAYVALRRNTDNRIALRPWLYRIAHNCSIDMLRKNGWDHDQLDPDFDGAVGPANLVEQKEELEQLVKSIRALPESQRRALTLREIEGRSYREIASELGHTEPAVRQLIFRGRTALRKLGAAMLVPFGFIRDRLAAAPQAADAQQAAFAASTGGEPVGSGLAQAGASLIAGVVVLAGAGAAQDGNSANRGEQAPVGASTLVAGPHTQSVGGQAAGSSAGSKRSAPAAKVRVNEQGGVEFVNGSAPVAPVSSPAPVQAGGPIDAAAPAAGAGSEPSEQAGESLSTPEPQVGKQKPPKAPKPPKAIAPKPVKAPKADRAPKPAKAPKAPKPDKAPKLEKAPKAPKAEKAPKPSVPRETKTKQPRQPKAAETPRSDANANPKRGGPAASPESALQAQGSRKGAQGPTQKTTGQARGPASGGTR